jgi:hypothetical protein
VDLGLNAVKDKIVDLKQQQTVRDKLKSFIGRQSKINVHCTYEEELDFEGLTKYISSDLIKDVKVRLFGNKSQRYEARKTIISKAITYSQANTKLAKNRAVKLTAYAIDILRNFYRNQINKDLLFMATEIEDTVSSNVNEQLANQTQQLTSIIHESGQSLLSIEQNLILVKNGQIGDVESRLTSWINSLSSGHVLFPDYGYKLKSVGGKPQFQSIPLSNEATKKYPPKIKLIGTVKIGNQYVNKISANAVDYANRHQLPIIIDVKEAQKLLGNIPDPVQHDAEKLVGKELMISPKPFPKAFPCSIRLDGNVVFEYILFRTQEILDDDTIVISNQEQSTCPFKISMKLLFSKQSVDFNLSIADGNNSDLLHYAQFMKKASEGAEITIKALSIGRDIIKGKLNPFKFKCGFDTVDNEILFLEKIISLEKYFGTNINIPNEIFSDDYDALCYIFTLISGEKVSNSWDKVEFSFELTNGLISKIMEMDNSKYIFSYVGNLDIPIYGEQYHLSIVRTYKQVKIKDLEKLKQKARILDIGDTIKIVCIPGESNGIGSYVDALHKEVKM